MWLICLKHTIMKTSYGYVCFITCSYIQAWPSLEHKQLLLNAVAEFVTRRKRVVVFLKTSIIKEVEIKKKHTNSDFVRLEPISYHEVVLFIHCSWERAEKNFLLFKTQIFWEQLHFQNQYYFCFVELMNCVVQIFIFPNSFCTLIFLV